MFQIKRPIEITINDVIHWALLIILIIVIAYFRLKFQNCSITITPEQYYNMTEIQQKNLLLGIK